MRYLITARTEDGRMYNDSRFFWVHYDQRHVLRPMRLAQAVAAVERIRSIENSNRWVFGVKVHPLPKKRFSDRKSPRYIRAL